MRRHGEPSSIPRANGLSAERRPARAPLSASILVALRESIAQGGAIPTYHRLELAVRELINSGTLAAPARLPPEKQLAALLHIDRGTLRRTLHRLERDELVERIPGRGTTLTRAKPDHEAR